MNMMPPELPWLGPWPQSRPHRSQFQSTVLDWVTLGISTSVEKLFLVFGLPKIQDCAKYGHVLVRRWRRTYQLNEALDVVYIPQVRGVLSFSFVLL